MREVKVDGSIVKSSNKIKISGSKSESNRILILNAIFKNIKINNLSKSDDTNVLHNALNNLKSKINIGHAGTSMRFLTAYLSLLDGKKFILSGSERMHERPIAVLVDALNNLGFNIKFLEKKGYPPLEIYGTRNTKEVVKLNANVSSQFISALALIGPSLKNGITIELDGEVISKPYIEMTISMLNEIGVFSSFEKNIIKIKSTKNIKDCTYNVESDWSSISYFFSIIALSKNLELTFSSFNKKSFQGDINVCYYYKQFGVGYRFDGNDIIIFKIKNFINSKKIEINLNDNPDLAQTIIVTSFGLNIPTKLTGLSTLKVKETDRLIALNNELSKLGAECIVNNDSIEILKSDKLSFNDVTINTYDDHRMALAFAPLSLIKPIRISNPGVVSKSFPDFWKTLEKLNFIIEYL